MWLKTTVFFCNSCTQVGCFLLSSTQLVSKLFTYQKSGSVPGNLNWLRFKLLEYVLKRFEGTKINQRWLINSQTVVKTFLCAKSESTMAPTRCLLIALTLTLLLAHMEQVSGQCLSFACPTCRLSGDCRRQAAQNGNGRIPPCKLSGGFCSCCNNTPSCSTDAEGRVSCVGKWSPLFVMATWEIHSPL